MPQPKRRAFPTRKLVLIARAEDFQDQREPPLNIGDLVRLNSGSPLLLVVDASEAAITVAWKNDGRVEEWELPRPCFHRARDAW